jgi:CBS domain-containing protein
VKKIRSAAKEETMKTVKEALKGKSGEVAALTPESTVFEAITLMADKEIGALLVMQGEILLGILTERDYARKIIIQGRSSKDTSVQEIMTTKVMVVNPGNSIEECLAIMTEKHVRHLPVVEHGKVVGIISIGDAVKAIISDQHFIISNLVNYIMRS